MQVDLSVTLSRMLPLQLGFEHFQLKFLYDKEQITFLNENVGSTLNK